MANMLIGQLLEQLDAGFDGSDEHSLLGNIRQIDAAGWNWKPQGSDRSIAGVIWHAGSAKNLREAHRRFVEAAAALSDDDLPAMRRVHWGAQYPTSFVINSIMQHDLFHAGEINHLRALMQGNDRWGYFTEPPPSRAD